MAFKPLQIVRTTKEFRSDNGSVPTGTRARIVSLLGDDAVAVKIADKSLPEDRQGDRFTVTSDALATTSRGRPRKQVHAAA